MSDEQKKEVIENDKASENDTEEKAVIVDLTKEEFEQYLRDKLGVK